MDEIDQIKNRNKAVENEKAWETSTLRRVIIAAITYAVAVVFMTHIEVPQPWLSALIPTGGFILSTLSLSIVKRWWIQKYGE